MAAATESIVVDSTEEVNHKEAYSDSGESQNQCVKADATNEENVSLATKKGEDKATEENETKKKFIEAPIPKVNPWSVNRAGSSKPAQKQNPSGKCHSRIHILVGKVNTAVKQLLSHLSESQGITSDLFLTV